MQICMESLKKGLKRVVDVKRHSNMHENVRKLFKNIGKGWETVSWPLEQFLMWLLAAFCCGLLLFIIGCILWSISIYAPWLFLIPMITVLGLCWIGDKQFKKEVDKDVE